MIKKYLEKLLIKFERSREIGSFIIVGGLSFLLEMLILITLVEIANISYLKAAAIAFIIAVIVNYLLCKRYVFITKIATANKKSQLKQAVLFIVISSIGLLINQICLFIAVDIFNFHYVLAKIIATLIVTTWNYFGKRWAISK